MSIIHKYLVREILKSFCIVILAVISIYIAVDFFEKIESFMNAKLPLSLTLSFFLFKTPFIIAQITPVAILLAILVTFGLMNKNNELIALKSSGIAPSYWIKPVVVIGVGISLGLFLFSEAVVPLTMSKANDIWLKDVKKRSRIIQKANDLWIKEKHTIIHIAYITPQTKAINGLTLNYMDDDFRLLKRLDAKTGVYRDGQWHLEHIMQQMRDPKNAGFKIQCLDHMAVTLPFDPQALFTVVKKPEEMTFTELNRYIHKVESEGYDATAYRVNLWAKTAFPMVCLIMALIGTGIATQGKSREKEGIAVGIASGIGIAFLYWICHSICLSFGQGGMLPPIIAAWSANLIFLAVSIMLLAGIE